MALEVPPRKLPVWLRALLGCLVCNTFFPFSPLNFFQFSFCCRYGGGVFISPSESFNFRQDFIWCCYHCKNVKNNQVVLLWTSTFECLDYLRAVPCMNLSTLNYFLFCNSQFSDQLSVLFQNKWQRMRGFLCNRNYLVCVIVLLIVVSFMIHFS